MKQIQEGIYMDKKHFFTENLSGERQFQETIIIENSKQYRLWDSNKSKLAAAMTKGVSCPIKKDSKVMYLGASHGYTVSYVSDIASQGFVFAIDFAPRVVRDLVFVAEKRPNIAVILADANKPETYYHYLTPADILYQDISQKNQVEIFLKNANLFLKKEGIAILALKARSIDSTKEPKKIFHQVRNELEKNLKIIDYRTLEPFHRDHCMFVCKR